MEVGGAGGAVGGLAPGAAGRAGRRGDPVGGGRTRRAGRGGSDLWARRTSERADRRRRRRARTRAGFTARGVQVRVRELDVLFTQGEGGVVEGLRLGLQARAWNQGRRVLVTAWTAARNSPAATAPPIEGGRPVTDAIADHRHAGAAQDAAVEGGLGVELKASKAASS